MNPQLLFGLSILGGVCLFTARWYWLKRRRTLQLKPAEPAADPEVALGENISEIYAQAYEEAGRLITETQHTTENRLQTEVKQLDLSLSALSDETRHTFDQVQTEVKTFFKSALAQTNTDIDEARRAWHAEITEATQSLGALISDTATSIADSQIAAKSMLQSIHDESTTLRAENAAIHQALKQQRLDIIAAAEVEAAGIRAEAEQQSAHFLAMSQQTFDQQLGEIKRASEQQISGATEKLMEQLGQETSMTINQIKKIVSQTQYQSWEKIEGFNRQILDKFEQITDHVINQGEARARSIGEKVLAQIEDEIVLFVIGIIKETLNLKLTPEEHQEIIMQAASKLKAEHQRTAAEAESTPDATHPLASSKKQAKHTPSSKAASGHGQASNALSAALSTDISSHFANIESPFFKIPEEAATLPVPDAVQTPQAKQEAVR